MSCLDFWAVGTTTGLAKMVASEGAWASKILSLSAWLRTAFISGSWAIWAAVRAIWAEDSWSSGFCWERAVPIALLTVPERIVWLAERLVRIKTPIPSSNIKLPTTKPQRVRRRRDFLSSRFSLDFLGKACKEEAKLSTDGTRLTISNSLACGFLIWGLGIFILQKYERGGKRQLGTFR